MNDKPINWHLKAYIKPIKTAICSVHERLLATTNHHYHHTLYQSVSITLSTSIFLITTAHANPNIADATIVNGTVTFGQPDAATLEITNTPNAIIDWNNFSIDAGQSTRFIQESVNSRVLNRVTGTAASDILGDLNSNGKVYLINPNGIVFGNNATVNTAGLVASTLNITNNDFITEKDRFNGTTGKITNQARLIMNGDGSIVLIAPEIENQNVIQTENGKLILAAGQSIELVADNLLFEIQASGSSALNLGELVTKRGEIGVFTDQLVQAGTVRATEVVQDANGNITLQAKSSLDIQAGSNIQSSGGNIHLQSEGTTTIAGQVSSDATTAGTVTVSGQQITISGGIGASGTNAGNIAIGDLLQDSVTGLQNTNSINVTGTLNANATGAGNGGAISLFADNSIDIAGELNTKGGTATGNSGGNIDLFAPQITVSGTVDASGNDGGTILMGGNTTSDTANTSLQETQNITVTNSGVVKADSLASGNGGDILAFANNALRVQGLFSAQGGTSAGNGGAIVMSGLAELSISSAPTLTAPNGNSGDWLLRSRKLAIDASKADIITTALNSDIKVGLLAVGETSSATKVGIRDADFKIGQLTLNKTSAGDVEINSAINKTSGDTASLDILGQTIAVNAPITSTSGALNVALLTETGQLSDPSTVNINATIDVNGGVLSASSGVTELVDTTAAVEDTAEGVAREATREAATVAENTERGVEKNTTPATEATDEKEEGSKNDDDKQNKEEERDQSSEKGSENTDQETEQKASPQRCMAR